NCSRFSDSSALKAVVSWGDRDPIKVFTTGDLIPDCAINKPVEKTSEIVTEDVQLAMQNDNDGESSQKASLEIENVLNENYLQPGNKVQTIISWNTDVSSSTLLNYEERETGERKQINVSEDLVTKHAVVLTTLKPATVYYFRAESVDAQGNIATSEEYSLRTPRPEENIIQKIKNNFTGLLLQIKPAN
ncbi:MAG: hypothetical protein ACD_5C00189G0001, partial [uncultured bacterium]